MADASPCAAGRSQVPVKQSLLAAVSWGVSTLLPTPLFGGKDGCAQVVGPPAAHALGFALPGVRPVPDNALAMERAPCVEVAGARAPTACPPWRLIRC